MLPGFEAVVLGGGNDLLKTFLGRALLLAILGSISAGGAPRSAQADGDDLSTDATAPLPNVDAAGPAATPSYGVFYERFEPTFYAGYAPRTLDPGRIELHVGRGNQVRATVVLSDEVLGSYAQDLLARYRTFRSLIDAGEIHLTQNVAFESLETTEQSLALEKLVADEKGLPAQAVRDRNLKLMERLNPGRVFRIRMPLDEVVGRWIAKATLADPEPLDARRQVELLNAMLPTRLFVDLKLLDAATTAELKALVAEARRLGDAPRRESAAALRPAFLRLFQRVTKDYYPVRADALEFAEFTALYPIGSANEFTLYKGRQIPLYPSPGRRQLMTHQRSNTIDHIAEVPTYSYSPWLPYMHVSPTMHNAFHTPYWELRPDRAEFLPDALRTTPARTREGKRYPFAYLLSRGPASHGCTHVNPGHLVELRQLLPSGTDRLGEVAVFFSKSNLFDVFDIDGDFEPEVMGVRYFVAYSIRDDKPGSMRAPIERRPFYDWLYGGELQFDPDGRGFFTNVQDATFEGDRAVEGVTYGRIRLYEAAYEPERIQFYATRSIPFIRELRKVGADHPFSTTSARADRAL